MPYLEKPTNDEGRLNLVKTSLKTSQSDATSGVNLLSEETTEEATSVSTNFENALKALTGTLADRSREISEKNDAVKNLETHIRDLWEASKRRVYRNKMSAEVLTFYMLPLSGQVPININENEIVPLAIQIIEGDKKAVAAGYPAAANPSALELTDALTKAQKEMSEVAPADRKMSNAQEELAAQRTIIDTLITDIVDELEYNLRKKEPATRRRIMRSYGVTFAYAVDEPVDEDTTAATTPAK